MPQYRGLRELLNNIPVFLVALLAIVAGELSNHAPVFPLRWITVAILVTLFTRHARLNSLPGYAAAAFLLTLVSLEPRASLLSALACGVASMAGVAVAVFALRLMHFSTNAYQRSPTVFLTFIVSFLAAFFTSVIGAVTLRSNIPYWNNLLEWIAVGWLSLFVLLPAMLSTPPLTKPALTGLLRQRRRKDWLRILPITALILSVLLAKYFGGHSPGAIIAPIPALIWCAFTYSFFTTTLLNVAVCAWWLNMLGRMQAWGHIDGLLPQSHLLAHVVVGLLTVSPLAIANLHQANQRLIRELNYAASHDELTGVLSRRGFLSRLQHSLKFRQKIGPKWLSVMMLSLIQI